MDHAFEAQQLCLPTLTAPAVGVADVGEAAVDVLLAEWDAQSPGGRRGVLATKVGNEHLQLGRLVLEARRLAMDRPALL